MSRDEILRSANLGENDQNTMESFTQRTMWRCVRQTSSSSSFVDRRLLAIKQYIVSLVISHSQNPELMEREKVYLNKLDVILVQVRRRRAIILDPSCPSRSWNTNGQRNGRTSSVILSRPVKPANRCVRIIWKSWNFSGKTRDCLRFASLSVRMVSARKSSTSPQVKWHRPKRNIWKTPCAMNSPRSFNSANMLW